MAKQATHERSHRVNGAPSEGRVSKTARCVENIIYTGIRKKLVLTFHGSGLETLVPRDKVSNLSKLLEANGDSLSAARAAGVAPIAHALINAVGEGTSRLQYDQLRVRWARRPFKCCRGTQKVEPPAVGTGALGAWKSGRSAQVSCTGSYW